MGSTLRLLGSILAPTWRPRSLQRCPRVPKSRPRVAQERPRAAQDSPRVPKTAQEQPRSRPRQPKSLPRADQDSQEQPRTCLGHARTARDPTHYVRLGKKLSTSPRTPSELPSMPQSGQLQKRAAAVLPPRGASIPGVQPPGHCGPGLKSSLKVILSKLQKTYSVQNFQV